MRSTAIMMVLALVACSGDKAAKKPDPRKATKPMVAEMEPPRPAKKILTIPANKSVVLIGPGADPGLLAGASQYFGTEDRSRYGVECLNKGKGFDCALEFPESHRKRKEYFCFAAWAKCAKGITTKSIKAHACRRLDRYDGSIRFRPNPVQCDRIRVTVIGLTDLRKKPWTKKDWDTGSKPGTVELKIR